MTEETLRGKSKTGEILGVPWGIWVTPKALYAGRLGRLSFEFIKCSMDAKEKAFRKMRRVPFTGWYFGPCPIHFR